MKAFERQPREGARAFAAFQMFLDLGPDRSIKQLIETSGLNAKRIRSWHTLNKWRDRALAWEEFLAESQRKRAEKILAKDSEKWAQRIIEMREDEFSLAKKLITKAHELLALPLTQQIIEKVDAETGIATVTIIKPVRTTLGDAAKFGAVASQLMRLASGAETSRGHVNVTVNADAEKIEQARRALEKLRDEMLATEAELSEVERSRVLRELPAWVAKDFGIKREQLEEDYLEAEEIVKLENSPLIVDTEPQVYWNENGNGNQNGNEFTQDFIGSLE
jgi:hypothetical protein